jgi:hypothetical protein
VVKTGRVQRAQVAKRGRRNEEGCTGAGRSRVVAVVIIEGLYVEGGAASRDVGSGKGDGETEVSRRGEGGVGGEDDRLSRHGDLAPCLESPLWESSQTYEAGRPGDVGFDCGAVRGREEDANWSCRKTNVNTSLLLLPLAPPARRLTRLSLVPGERHKGTLSTPSDGRHARSSPTNAACLLLVLGEIPRSLLGPQAVSTTLAGLMEAWGTYKRVVDVDVGEGGRYEGGEEGYAEDGRHAGSRWWGTEQK